MKRLLITLFLVTQACSTSLKTSESVMRMHSFYQKAVSFENSDFCFNKDEHTHSRRQVNASHGREFWKAFSAYRQEKGSEKANNLLRSIVQQQGLSITLLTPINDDLRGDEVDRLIESMLLGDHKKTRLLVEAVGSPADLSLVRQIRDNRGL